MVTRQTLVVVGVVLAATLGVVVPVVNAAPGADHTTLTESALQTATDAGGTDHEGATEGSAGNESAFGTQVAAFMQSNAAQTEDTVENGMWEAAFERANGSERARLAERRAEKLDDRLAELRERNRTLHDRYRNGSLSYDEYVSAASRLGGQIEALEDGVNGTVRAAERAGVDESTLDELRSNAKNLSGPAVAGIARELTSGDRGPPAKVPGNGPPGANATDRPGGPPEDVPGNGPDAGSRGNATGAGNVTAGPPEDRGPGSGNATGNPDASGQGNDGPPGRDDGSAGDGADGARGNDDSGSDRPGNSGERGASGGGTSGTDAPGNDGAGNADRGASNSNGSGGETGASGDGEASSAEEEDRAAEDESDRGSGGSNGAGNGAGGANSGGPNRGPNVFQPGGILFTN